jgi:hypothetical protein
MPINKSNRIFGDEDSKDSTIFVLNKFIENLYRGAVINHVFDTAGTLRKNSEAIIDAQTSNLGAKNNIYTDNNTFNKFMKGISPFQ